MLLIQTRDKAHMVDASVMCCFVGTRLSVCLAWACLLVNLGLRKLAELAQLDRRAAKLVVQSRSSPRRRARRVTYNRDAE